MEWLSVTATAPDDMQGSCRVGEWKPVPSLLGLSAPRQGESPKGGVADRSCLSIEIRSDACWLPLHRSQTAQIQLHLLLWYRLRKGKAIDVIVAR